MKKSHANSDSRSDKNSDKKTTNEMNKFDRFLKHRYNPNDDFHAKIVNRN